MVYLDDPAEAEATVEELRAASAATVAIRADIGDELDVERLFTETEAAFGGVDVVVHTTTGGALVNQHAARRLRPGGAIVATSGADDVTPALAEQLRARGVTMNGIMPGVASPGRPHDVAELLAILDGWQSASSFDP